VCLGIGAWVAARPKPVEARPAQAGEPQPTGKHFTGKVQFDVLAKLLADDRRSAPGNDWLRELADPKATFRVKTQTHPLLEHAALDFTLEDHRGQRWNLQGQLSRGPLVLVFYLGYACNACVHDLFELNADLERFHSLGAEVVALSGDPPALTRQRFEQYGAFGFPVLSDPDHVVALSYGTFRPAKGSKPEELLHGTFLIGRDGQVHWMSYGDTPFRNNKALLYELARLENKVPQPEPSLGTIGKEPKRP
jgi:peroxiredoxin